MSVLSEQQKKRAEENKRKALALRAAKQQNQQHGNLSGQQISSNTFSNNTNKAISHHDPSQFQTKNVPGSVQPIQKYPGSREKPSNSIQSFSPVRITGVKSMHTSCNNTGSRTTNYSAIGSPSQKPAASPGSSGSLFHCPNSSKTTGFNVSVQQGIPQLAATGLYQGSSSKTISQSAGQIHTGQKQFLEHQSVDTSSLNFNKPPQNYPSSQCHSKFTQGTSFGSKFNHSGSGIQPESTSKQAGQSIHNSNLNKTDQGLLKPNLHLSSQSCSSQSSSNTNQIMSKQQLNSLLNSPHKLAERKKKAKTEGTCVLISRTRFEVKVRYNPELIQLFKTMETKQYGKPIHILVFRFVKN